MTQKIYARSFTPVVTEVSPNLDRPPARNWRVREQSDLFSYAALAPGDEGDDNAREKIFANFRVLARTNLVLRRGGGVSDPRSVLSGVFSPDAIAALEELQREIVRDELRALSASRIRSRNRTEYLTVQEAVSTEVVFDLFDANAEFIVHEMAVARISWIPVRVGGG